MTAHLNENLSAYLDGELDDTALAAAESHLLECAACQGELESLRRVVRRAKALDDRPPEQDLWAGIARQLSTPDTSDVVPIHSRRRRFAFSIPQLAAAAIALMALSAGAASLALRHGAGTPVGIGAPGAPSGGVVPVVYTPGDETVASYDSAIRGMQALVQGRQLDTATARVVQQSLTVIDLAIRQAREALSKDPNNMYLNGQLQRTLDRKLDLLRRAVTMPAAS